MVWNWNPDLGRWRFDQHGYPAVPEQIKISTAGIAQTDSYDYWRELAFSDFEPDPINLQERLLFKAQAHGVCSARADFFLTDSDAVSGGRERRHIEQDGLDSLSIGLVAKGARHSENAGTETLVKSGGLFAYDASLPGRVSWTAHKGIYIVIRRPEAQAALGEIPTPAEMMSRLERSPMRHIVADQFRMFARHMPTLNLTQRAYVLDQTAQLTLFALAQHENRTAALEEATYLPAALRYIELHLASPTLDAMRIAAALNCSRSTLYRAFAQHGLGVAETIRDARLDRARMLIETLPTRAISTLALECGLLDTVNFSRQFRKRFGLSPSDARALAASPQHSPAPVSSRD